MVKGYSMMPGYLIPLGIMMVQSTPCLKCAKYLIFYRMIILC